MLNNASTESDFFACFLIVSVNICVLRSVVPEWQPECRTVNQMRKMVAQIVVCSTVSMERSGTGTKEKP